MVAPVARLCRLNLRTGHRGTRRVVDHTAQRPCGGGLGMQRTLHPATGAAAANPANRRLERRRAHSLQARVMAWEILQKPEKGVTSPAIAPWNPATAWQVGHETVYVQPTDSRTQLAKCAVTDAIRTIKKKGGSRSHRPLESQCCQLLRTATAARTGTAAVRRHRCCWLPTPCRSW